MAVWPGVEEHRDGHDRHTAGMRKVARSRQHTPSTETIKRACLAAPDAAWDARLKCRVAPGSAEVPGFRSHPSSSEVPGFCIPVVLSCQDAVHQYRQRLYQMRQRVLRSWIQAHICRQARPSNHKFSVKIRHHCQNGCGLSQYKSKAD